jgi:hypothetical protein
MSAFDIPPHPRRTTRLALGALALVAATGFAEGFLRQLDATAPAPPPAAPQGPAIAEATPAPVLQVADTARKPPRPAADAAPPASDAPADAEHAAAAPDAPAAQPAPAADASATGPEPQPAAPPASPADPPT